MGFFISFLSTWLPVVIDWISERYVEIIATAIGFVYILFSVKGDKRLWLYGLISSALYVYICYVAGIYADMAINTYYVIISIYGWSHWNEKQSDSRDELPISHTNLKETLLIISINGLLFIFIAYILSRFTGSTIPYWDAFTTSGSITATWMLARKKKENWLLWIVVDAVSVGLYIYKGLYPTSGLFLVYTILAIIGYYKWNKKWLVQQKG